MINRASFIILKRDGCFASIGDDWISEFARKQELEAKAKKLKVLLFSVPVTEHFFNLSTGCYFPVHLFLAKSIH